MPYIKVVRGPNQTRTGNIFGIEFKDGCSVENLPMREALRFSTVMGIVDAKTGEPISAVGRERKMRSMKQDEVKKALEDEIKSDSELEKGESKDSEPAQEPEKASEPQDEQTPAPEQKADEPQGDADGLWDFTREELEALADKEGIEGLREFANKRGVRGKAIAGIIDSLMAKKAPKAPAVNEAEVKAPASNEADAKGADATQE